MYIPVEKGMHTVPAEYNRGAFRYLTFSLSLDHVQSMRVAFSLSHVYSTASPQQGDLQEYSGYFNSSDSLLNRIRHAGVYTLQLCTISANSSVQHTRLLSSGWPNDAQATGLEATDVILTDGAKRDRTPCPGDLEVELSSALVSLNFDNIGTVRNTFSEILRLQDAGSGYIPYAGSPLGDLLKGFGSLGEYSSLLVLTVSRLTRLVDIPLYGSDTYHSWTIIGYVEYILVKRDFFARQHWKSVSRGLEATFQYIDNETGLMNGTKTLDWGRVGQGGQNTAVNALLYHALNLMAQLSAVLKTDQDKSNNWTTIAEKLKTSANKLLYDEKQGMFYDNTTSTGHTLYPQDGNVAAINFNLTTSHSQSITIAENLSRRLTKYGAPSPELPGSISPFISSQELRAQFAASPDDVSRAMNLLRTQWKYMMDLFSNSTFIEGYADDGSLNYGFYPGGSGFISHAHGWSTRPVYSLLANVVGLRATALDVPSEDGDWVFQPSVRGSELMWARGEFNMSCGIFGAKWDIGEGNSLLPELLFLINCMAQFTL